MIQVASLSTTHRHPQCLKLNFLTATPVSIMAHPTVCTKSGRTYHADVVTRRAAKKTTMCFPSVTMAP